MVTFRLEPEGAVDSPRAQSSSRTVLGGCEKPRGGLEPSRCRRGRSVCGEAGKTARGQPGAVVTGQGLA